MYQKSVINKVLAGLVVLDIVLTIWAFFFPELWFEVFHGAAYVDPQALLQRCGANWAAFALLQALVWKKWEQKPGWLLVAAGVRFSDIFTDITCAIFASSLSTFGMIVLPLMLPANLLLGLYLMQAYQRTSKQVVEI